jgi:hypothetical protein
MHEFSVEDDTNEDGHHVEDANARFVTEIAPKTSEI